MNKIKFIGKVISNGVVLPFECCSEDYPEIANEEELRKHIVDSFISTVRYDNGSHAWLDVWCPKVNKIRNKFNLLENINFGGHPRHFHLTVGRW